jgi:hypothetical protein
MLCKQKTKSTAARTAKTLIFAPIALLMGERKKISAFIMLSPQRKALSQVDQATCNEIMYVLHLHGELG